MKKLLIAATLVGLILIGQGTAYAIPILQLYVEGAVYDATTESWVWYPGLTDGPPRLWAIGNTGGEGGKGDILNVKLAVAYSAQYPGLEVFLSPSTTGGYGGFTDPSVPDDPIQNGNPDDPDSSWPIQTNLGPFIEGTTEVTNGGVPMLSNGKALPTHGIYYGEDTLWQEFLLGDFTLRDSPIADFIDALPTSGGENEGQINVYQVSVTAWSEAVLHFDLYDAIEGHNRARFAPFSHDVEISPEPASFVVWFLIGLSWAGSAWTYQYRRRWKKWQQEDAAESTGMRGLDQADRFTESADHVEEQVGIRPAGRWAAHRSGR